MKILYIVDKFPKLSETFVSDQVRDLISRGEDVRVLAWAGRGVSSATDLDSLLLTPTPKIPDNIFTRYLCSIARYLRTAKKHKTLYCVLSSRFGRLAYSLIPLYAADCLSESGWMPDAVVAHFGNNGVVASALKHAGIIAAGTPCLVFFHAYEISCRDSQKIAQEYGATFSDGTILLPISRLWRQKLIEAGAPGDKVVVSHMGVDVNNIKYRARNLADSTLSIATVGRMVEKKGHRYAVEAVIQFAKTYPHPIKYTIAGDGPLFDEISKQIKMAKSTESWPKHLTIDMPGAVIHRQAIDLISQTDVFLLPSVTSADGDMEGIPVSLMEAMASGAICISTRHSGIPELITDHKEGFLSEERNVNDIVAALDEITRMDAIAIQHITDTARKKVEHEFDNKALNSALLDLIYRAS